MVEVAGGGKDHVAAVEAVGVIGEQLLLVERATVAGGTQDRLAQGMILPETLGEELVDQHVGIIFVDLDLFQDHAAFALDIVEAKTGFSTRSASTSSAMGT